MSARGEREVVGLIAGQGQLPMLVARGIRRAGARVCCVGLRDQFDAQLPALCDEFAQAGILQLGRWIRLLRRGGVRETIMVGRVAKTRMHDPLRLFRQLPDRRAAILWYRRLRRDRRTAAVLAALADELERSGVPLIDSTAYIPEHLAAAGVMTRRAPTAAQTADVRFAWPLLERLAEIDVGQAMTVRERDVIAVEAIEGTERLIARTGELCRASGWTLLKTMRAGGDRRADVPTVGVETIEQVARCGGGCLALGAGCVIMIDRPAVVEAADRAGIAIVGIERSR